LTQQSKDYKSGIFERGVVGGLQSMLMPEVYSGIKEEFGKGLDYLKGLGGTEELASAAQVADVAGAAPEFAAGFGTAPVHDGMAASGLQLPGMPKLGAAPSMSMEGFGSGIAGKLGAMPTTTVASQGLGAYTGSAAENLAMARKLGLDLSGGQTVRSLYEGAGLGPWSGAAKQYSSLFGRGGGWIPMMPRGGYVDPQLPNVPMGPPRANVPMGAGPQLPNAPMTMGPPRPNVPMGAGPPRANVPMRAGLPDPYADSPMAGVVQGGPTTGGTQDLTPGPLSDSARDALEGFQVFGDDNPVLGDDTDWSGLYGDTLGTTPTPTDPTTTTDPAGAGSTGYGTAIGTQSALTQMGMGHIASDPRLQDYLKDLPQFSQGYQQQFGDVQRGGRQALSQMYASQRNTGGGFAGAGSGAQAFGQQYSGLMGEQGRQRRGVVEGFQSDLLSGIRDIEQRGDFTFGQGPGGTTNKDDAIKALIDQGYTQEDAERQIWEDMQGGSGGIRS
jgi:hypothetical protein